MMSCKVKASCTYLHTNLILGSISQNPTAAWPAKELVRPLTNPQVQLLPHVHSIAHSLVGLGQVFTGHRDGSGGDLRETGPQHLQTGLHCRTEMVTKVRTKSHHPLIIKGSLFLGHLERKKLDSSRSCEASNWVSNMLSQREFIIAAKVSTVSNHSGLNLAINWDRVGEPFKTLISLALRSFGKRKTLTDPMREFHVLSWK